MNVWIIDDNPEQAVQLCQLLKEIEGEWSEGAIHVEVRNDGSAMLAELAAMKPAAPRPDLILEDIELGEDNGIDVARKILEMSPRSQIIFVSGHDDYYLDVYDVEHLWFLRKPIEKDVLRKAVDRASRKLEEGQVAGFYYEENRRRHTVPLHSILFLESDRRRVLIHTEMDPTGCNHVYYGTLKEAEAQLMPGGNSRSLGFLRCHHSYIVNLNKVSSCNATEFYLGNMSIPISRRLRKNAEEAFMDIVEKRMRR